MDSIEFAKTVFGGGVLSAQSAAISAASGLIFKGKGDPVRAACLAGRAGGLAVAVGFAASAIFEVFYGDSANSDDSLQFYQGKSNFGASAQVKGAAVGTIAGIVAVLGSHLLSREFPIAFTVSCTAMGVLGSVGSFALFKKIDD